MALYILYQSPTQYTTHSWHFIFCTSPLLSTPHIAGTLYSVPVPYSVHHTYCTVLEYLRNSAVCITLLSQSPQYTYMHHTVESIVPNFSGVKNTISQKKSAECITLQRQSLQGVNLRGVHHTAESDSAVCITPSRQSPRRASHRKDKLHTGD